MIMNDETVMGIRTAITIHHSQLEFTLRKLFTCITWSVLQTTNTMRMFVFIIIIINSRRMCRFISVKNSLISEMTPKTN